MLGRRFERGAAGAGAGGEGAGAGNGMARGGGAAGKQKPIVLIDEHGGCCPVLKLVAASALCLGRIILWGAQCKRGGEATGAAVSKQHMYCSIAPST